MLETGATEVRCSVEVGGRVSSHQGLNLPGADVALPAAGREDLAWVDFAVEHGIDLLAVSFVRRAEDLEPVERRVRTGGSDIPVIAKIEKPQAAERAEEIVKAVTAGVMIARGDLGIELPIEQVPTVQRKLLALAGKLLAPLDHRDADARLDGRLPTPDAGRGLRRRQRDLPGHRRGDALRGDRRRPVPGRGGPGDGPRRARDRARASLRRLGLQPRRRRPLDVASSVARAAVGSTYTLGLAAIVVPTRSGRTARLVSAHRPRTPVLAISPRIETVRRLNLLFGIQCALQPRWTGLTALLDDCARLARETGVAKSGDLIAITAGLPQQNLGTNLFEVHRVP